MRDTHRFVLFFFSTLTSSYFTLMSVGRECMCVCVMRARLIMHTVRQAHNHTFNTFFFHHIHMITFAHMLYAGRADNASERCIGEKKENRNKQTDIYEEKKSIEIARRCRPAWLRSLAMTDVNACVYAFFDCACFVLICTR